MPAPVQSRGTAPSAGVPFFITALVTRPTRLRAARSLPGIRSRRGRALVPARDIAPCSTPPSGRGASPMSSSPSQPTRARSQMIDPAHPGRREQQRRQRGQPGRGLLVADLQQQRRGRSERQEDGRPGALAPLSGRTARRRASTTLARRAGSRRCCWRITATEAITQVGTAQMGALMSGQATNATDGPGQRAALRGH